MRSRTRTAVIVVILFGGELAVAQVPNPPSNLVANPVSGRQIDLNWTDNSDNETGFQIQRSVGGVGGYLILGTLPANTTNCSDKALVPDTGYVYRVRAMNGSEKSGYSNLAATNTPSLLANSWSAGNGRWEDPAKWSLGVAPTNTQSMFITNSLNETVTLDAASTNAPLTFTVSDLFVGSPAAGTTNIVMLSNVGTVPLRVRYRFEASSNSYVMVSNAVIQCDEPGVLAPHANIDCVVDGALELCGGDFQATNRALVIANGAPATVLVNGGQLAASSVAVTPYVANTIRPAGTLTINAGTVTTGSLTLGAKVSPNAGTGTVWMTGGSLVVGGFYGMAVGSLSGVGQMTISNGFVYTPIITIGSYTPAGGGEIGTLTVAGGSFSLTNPYRFSPNVTVGSGGSGSVWIVGGQLSTTNGIMLVQSGGLLSVSNGGFLVREMWNQGGMLRIAGGSSAVQTIFSMRDCTSTTLVTGGSLFITNATHDATLEEDGGGTFTVAGGMVVIDKLVVTSACGRFIHTGGTLSITSTNLATNISAVGDGIPNGWKLQYSLDPFDPNLANKDADGDGFTNLQEFQAGTDPTNSASVFRISGIASEGDDMRVTWTMGSGKTNALQVATDGTGDYSTNNFSDIFVVTNTIGNATNYLDVGGATNALTRFYRVRLVP